MKQTNWLLRPSRLPRAPSWRVVFALGAVWNAAVERCWWAAVACSMVVLALPALDRADRKLFG